MGSPASRPWNRLAGILPPLPVRPPPRTLPESVGEHSRAVGLLFLSAFPGVLVLAVAVLEVGDVFKLRRLLNTLFVFGWHWPWDLGVMVSGPLALFLWTILLFGWSELTLRLLARTTRTAPDAARRFVKEGRKILLISIAIGMLAGFIFLASFTLMMIGFAVAWMFPAGLLLLTSLTMVRKGAPWSRWVPSAVLAAFVHAAWVVCALLALSSSGLISERVVSISSGVQAISFSQDGTVVTATFGGGISPESFAVDTGRPVPRPPGAEAPPPYAGDGQRVLTDGMSIALVDEVIEFSGPWGSRRVQGHYPMETKAIALSPDGKRLASCGTDNVVRLWNPADGSLRKTLWGHSDDVLAVAFSPDGRRLASASVDGTLRLWSGF